MLNEKFIVYLDTGGTFSDAVVIKSDGSFVTGKASTTPDDLEECFFNCIEDASKKLGMSLETFLSRTDTLGFGTTAGTNTLLTRHGAPKLGLITTKGFEDTTLIMRGVGRWIGLSLEEGMHIAGSDKPEPLIPRKLIKGVTERVDCLGNVVIGVYEDEVREAVKKLCDEGVEGIAVVFLWSFLNDINERRVKEIIDEMSPGVSVSLSVDIAPLIREYARFNSTIIDLYIGKQVRKLLSKVGDKLNHLGYKKPLLVMQASGGLSRSDVVKSVSTLHSGPVGGLRGIEFFKNLYGFENVMGSDVGGTSFDISIVSKHGAEYIREPVVCRWPLANPMLEIISIGAGGGTIAYIDEFSGQLRVGPQSSGAMPGPVSYNLGGTEPTVTDADVIMNRIDPDYFLGGKMKLEKEKAINAMKEKIANPLSMKVEEASQGVCNIIDNTMKATLAALIGEKGFDVKDFVLFAFGGAGATHCAGYSRDLGFKKIVIPPFASTFSAFGSATTDVMHRYNSSAYIVIPHIPFQVTTRKFELTSLEQIPQKALERFNQMYETMEQKAYMEMKEEGFKKENIKVRYQMEMRYGGQLYEIVSASPVGRINTLEDMKALIQAFENEYERLYTKQAMYPEGGIEIITLILEISASTIKPAMVKRDYDGKDPSSAQKGNRDVFFDDGYKETNIYDMDRLKYGNFVKGPAIIESIDTTVVVPPDFIINIDEYLFMVMEQVK